MKATDQPDTYSVTSLYHWVYRDSAGHVHSGITSTLLAARQLAEALGYREGHSLTLRGEIDEGDFFDPSRAEDAHVGFH